MAVFKTVKKDISAEAGTLIGNVASENVRNATSEAISGMELFKAKAFQTSNASFDQAKGNLFEYIEAAKFNRNAATASSNARAFVTDA